MLVLQRIIFQITFLKVFFQINGLIELPATNNYILNTDIAIKDTINKLFSNLNFDDLTDNVRFKQYATIHDYFTSLTEQHNNNLKQITELSRADNKKIDNENENIIEILNEISKSYDGDEINEIPTDDDNNVAKYTKEFLNELRKLKQLYNINDKYVDINKEVLNLLEKEDNMSKLHISSEYLSEDILKSGENDSFINETEFWEPSGRRIFRGQKTKIKYFPFMASIHFFRKFQCAGSIIKSDLIITASSCLQLAWNNRFFRENPAFLSVRVGSSFYDGGGEDIPILEVYFHPNYNPKNLRNNLCLLRLLRQLKFRRRSRKIKKIEIDRNPTSLSMTTDGITIVGWGAKGTGNIIHNPWENILSFAVLDVYLLEECQDIYSREYVTRKNFCAGFVSKGGGACNRDVGGPGIVNGILTGVVSFGSPICGSPDVPTVFTKVGYYADWIDEIMEQEVPRGKKRTTLQTTFNYRPFVTSPFPSTTEFKIDPIGTKLRPVGINDIDSLRSPSVLFKDFLNTMFTSKEVEQYHDILEDDGDKTIRLNSINQPIETQEFVNNINTDMEDINDITESNADYPKKYTMLDKNLNIENEAELEKEVVKLIDNIDLKKIIQQASTAIPEIVSNKKLIDNTKLEKLLKEQDTKDIKKNFDDSILTLLYLSDTEKQNNVLKQQELTEEEEENGGLSIAMEGFKDLTYRNRNASGEFYDFLSKNELYDLLADAIDTETQNIQTKSYIVFILVIIFFCYRNNLFNKINR